MKAWSMAIGELIQELEMTPEEQKLFSYILGVYGDRVERYFSTTEAVKELLIEWLKTYRSGIESPLDYFLVVQGRWEDAAPLGIFDSLDQIIRLFNLQPEALVSLRDNEWSYNLEGDEAEIDYSALRIRRIKPSVPLYRVKPYLEEKKDEN